MQFSHRSYHIHTSTLISGCDYFCSHEIAGFILFVLEPIIPSELQIYSKLTGEVFPQQKSTKTTKKL